MVLAASDFELLSFYPVSEDHRCQTEQKFWRIDFSVTFGVRKSRALSMCHWSSYGTSRTNIRTYGTAQLDNSAKARDTFVLIHEETLHALVQI
jgi:hypothetical protein